MLKCDKCETEHDGSYGTGKYCSKKCRYAKSDETKKKMSKPKKDSSKMGKYDKSGSNNPNSVSKSGNLKDRNGKQYENVLNSNKENGQRWTNDHREKHSKIMLGESNYMRNKKHTEVTKTKISNTKIEQYKNGLININRINVSRAEEEISNHLNSLDIKHITQFRIQGFTFIYDFFLIDYNIIIEYNGDYWHANPEIYENDKIIDGRTAEEIWSKDKLKKEIAEENGFKFYSIWENKYKPGYKNNYDNKIIEKIINENEKIIVPGS